MTQKRSRTGEPIVNYPCPLCRGKMEVKDSRPSVASGSQTIRRRRQCKKCGHKVTTYEMTDIKELLHCMTSIVTEARQVQTVLSALLSAADSIN